MRGTGGAGAGAGNRPPRMSCGSHRSRNAPAARRSRIALPVRQFGLEDSRGAGADEHADSPAPPAARRLLDRIHEAVLPQSAFAPIDCCGSRSVAARRAVSHRRRPPPHPTCVSSRTVSNAHGFSPLCCLASESRVSSRPSPIQLAAVNALSSSGFTSASQRSARWQKESRRSSAGSRCRIPSPTAMCAIRSRAAVEAIDAASAGEQHQPIDRLSQCKTHAPGRIGDPQQQHPRGAERAAHPL